jgi:hypothetical protein
LWAYERHEGFREQELIEKFGLREADWKMRWFLSVFKNGTNDNTPILIHMYNKRDGENEIGYWGLSEKGMSSAIDYLELSEARKNSRQAMWIAIGSLVLATIVGIAQIYVQIKN